MKKHIKTEVLSDVPYVDIGYAVQVVKHTYIEAIVTPIEVVDLDE